MRIYGRGILQCSERSLALREIVEILQCRIGNVWCFERQVDFGEVPGDTLCERLAAGGNGCALWFIWLGDRLRDLCGRRRPGFSLVFRKDVAEAALGFEAEGGCLLHFRRRRWWQCHRQDVFVRRCSWQRWLDPT